jgi:hypothetical protein
LPETLVRTGTTTELVVAAGPGTGDPATITRVCVTLGYYGDQYCADTPGEDGRYHVSWVAPPNPDRGTALIHVTMDDGYVHLATGPVVKVGRPPAPPRITEVRPADGSLTVLFTPSYEYQPIAVTSYDVTLGDVTRTVAAGVTSVTFEGLTNLRSYDVGVRATNELGTGAAATTTAAPGIASRLLWGSYPSQAGYGTALTVSATLQRADTGAPLAGRTVVLERCTDGDCVTEATGPVAADGTVAVSATMLTSGRFRLRYAGDGVIELPAVGPSEAGWTVRVVPHADLALSAARAAPGETVRLTATVAPGTAGLDLLFQRYQVTAYGSTVTNLAPAAVDASGAYLDVALPAGTYNFLLRMYSSQTGTVLSDPVTLTVG